MFSTSDELFELEENESTFKEICKKLKTHPFQSPWSACFENKYEKKSKSCNVQELHVPEEFFSKHSSSDSLEKLKENCDNNHISIAIDEEKFLSLKKYFANGQDLDQAEHISDTHLLSTITLLEVPKLCEFIGDVISNEEAVSFFLQSILALEKPLSITIVAALVKKLIMPKILSFKLCNCRNLSLSIMSFFQVFPKTTIEEIIIPCLKSVSLEPSLQEMLFKLVKTDMSKDYVICAIKIILNEALPSENTFMIIQSLIEKKIPLDANVHNDLAFTLENWSSSNGSNMKFIKLIISILSTYGSELSELQLKIYSDVIKVNKTIMKKAAENVFKKLKQA